MRKETAIRLINMLDGVVKSTLIVLGNGKIPNVLGRGALVIHISGNGEITYTISDTEYQHGRWVIRGARRAGAIYREQAIELLTAYGDSKTARYY